MPESRTCPRCGRLKATFYTPTGSASLRCPSCPQTAPPETALQPLRAAIAAAVRAISQG